MLAFALNPNGARFPCQIRNISDRGAMLEFLGSHVTMLENAFDLVLADAKARYAVEVVWRKERTAGVLFCLDKE
ncbi:PilZ domain-containing protein [Methylobacterium sp. J-030]|nr:PilZ domain-containing protein [Methylobacterium sp. J-030]MCJ2073221.1 PilZ domain-containing protein [Methylobacterium sp. J-030]